MDPIFDAEASERMDEDDVGERFCEDFMPLLDSDQRISLGVFCHFNWKSCSTRAAELAGRMIGRSDNSIRTWKSKFLETGEILDIMQGNVQKTFKETFINIQNYRKVKHSKFAYLEGISGGSDLENQVKK